MFRALVVEHEQTVAESIQERLTSINHAYKLVTDMESALSLIESDEYSYGLFSLAMPHHAGTPPDVKNGWNLLATVREKWSYSEFPVIFLIDREQETFQTAHNGIRHGVNGLIIKPVGAGEPIEDGIREVLEKVPFRVLPELHEHKKRRVVSGGVFTGGLLEYYKDRIDLRGVEIAGKMGESRPRRVLDFMMGLLFSDHDFRVRCSGIASELGFSRGPTAAAEVMREIRERCTNSMREELGLACGMDQVIANDENGYFFASGIDVQNRIGTGSVGPKSELTNLQIAILRELRRENSLSRKKIGERLQIRLRSLDAQIAILVSQGKVMREGNGPAVKYKLVSTAKPEAGHLYL